jgi:molybdopterin molybdotransferase
VISLAEARALIQTHITPVRPRQIPLQAAKGCVLRQAIRATEDLPPFDRSAMDGYAVAPGQNSDVFRLIGEVKTGQRPRFRLKRGEGARIFTGGQIPKGALKVIPQEFVGVEENRVSVTRESAAEFIRRRGEDARKGDLLLESGSRLGAGELALLASLGVTRPTVSPPIRVAHFATGDELVAPSQKPKAGQIRDSNSTLVAAAISKWGGQIVAQERVRDNFDLLVSKVSAAREKYDLLLVSGGASVGDYDFGKKLLEANHFKIHFEKISLRPGKPLIFATRKGQAAFILPGNPVSHYVTLQVAVRLALDQFSGAPVAWPETKIRLAEDFDYRADPRETYWPARVEIRNGEFMAQALRWQSSGDATALAGANALLRFEGNLPKPKPGDFVSAFCIEMS